MILDGTPIRIPVPGPRPLQVLSGPKGDTGAPGGSDTAQAGWINDPASQTRAALSATYAAMVKAPTGVAATDTANIQAAIDSLPASGGDVRLQLGAYSITALVTTKRVHLIGVGGRPLTTSPGQPVRGQTSLVSTSTTETLLALGRGSAVTGVAIVNDSTTVPTAGAGLTCSQSMNINLTDVAVAGFYDCIDLEGQQYCDLSGCLIAEPVRYGLRLRNTAAPDSGDSTVRGCTFLPSLRTTDRTGAAAIRLESGGGLKVTGSKINWNGSSRWLRGIDVDIAGTVATSDLIVTGNSLENCTARHISVRSTNTAGFGNIVVTGNQIYGSGDGVWLGDSAGKLMETVSIHGNTFTSVARSVYVENTASVSIGGNAHKGVPVIVDVGANAEHVEVAKQSIRHIGINNLIVQRRSTSGASNNRQGERVCLDSISLPSGATTVTYVDLYTVSVAQFAAVRLELEFSGLLDNVGSTLVRQRRSLSLGATGGTVTVATLGIDETTGQGLDVLYDTSVPNQVTVRARLVAASTATGSHGVIRLRVSDFYTQVTRVPAA